MVVKKQNDQIYENPTRLEHMDDFCQLFSWFKLFSYGEKLPNVAGQSEQVKKMDNLKEGVYSFSYFTWFRVILFHNQNHPWFNQS